MRQFVLSGGKAMKTSREFDSPTPDPDQFLLENMLNGFVHCQMHFEQGQPRDFTYLRVNPAFENLTGLKNVVGKRVSEVIPRLRESDPEVFEMYGRVASTGVPEQMETFVAAMGIWFSIAAYSPKRGHFVAVFDVITERKQAEIELRRLNRSLRTISECNQILVRAENETDLLNQVCESLVKEGGYRLAWVGFAENDEGKTVHPVAHAGFEEGYLQIANISWAETERGQGPTGRALRTGNIEVARETLADPTFALWREEALKRGYASSITLPLKSKGRVLGGIMIYSVEPDAFDPAEVALLAELADDLAYGVQALRTRAAHQRLEEENAYLASIVESSDDAIIGKSLEGVIQSWNAGAEKLYGYTSSEAVGKSILLIIPPERQAEFEEFLQAIKRGEKIRHHDTVRLTKDGRRIDVAVSISPLKNSSGQLFGASSVARDITERKRAEAALVEERHLLHTLMDNLPDLIYFKDLAGRFTRINLAHAEGFGLSDPAEALGRSDFDFFAADHARKAYEDEQEIIQTGKPMVGKEEKEVWPDGHVSWVSTTKMPLRDTNGNIIGTFGVSRDITEHKRAEEALQESEERFRSLVENATVGIYRTTPEGRILMANPTLISMLGFQDFAELASRDLEKEGFEPGYARHHFRERMERDGEVRGLGAPG
jgi:PAS domain S-box-containing protein